MKRALSSQKTVIAAIFLGCALAVRLVLTEYSEYYSMLLALRGEDSLKAGIDKRITMLESELATLQRRFWLEDLEPVFNFRPKFWLGKTSDVEDKDQVIPYFLAIFLDTTSYPRRIYIDLGIKDFESSMCWMVQHYPTKFDRIYGFESASDFSNVAELGTNVERCIQSTTAQGTGYHDVKETLDSMSLYYNYVGLDDDPSTLPPTVGLSKFFRDAGIEEDDSVVMKMDVEGIEFDLIERMLDDGTYTLIDELFVEIHYKHPDMSPWGWNGFAHSRNEAQAMLTKARDAGMFVHPWP